MISKNVTIEDWHITISKNIIIGDWSGTSSPAFRNRVWIGRQNGNEFEYLHQDGTWNTTAGENARFNAGYEMIEALHKSGYLQ